MREVEIKYAYQKKHSPEYKAMQEEEKKLLANNRFDEAIALQKLRRKKEEEDNIRYRMIHRNEMETLKKNVNNTYNKEFTNFQNRKNNEIEMIKKEMNIALDNLDKQFNKKRHDLIVRDNNNNLIKTNKPLAKSRLFTNQSLILNQNDRNNIKRIFSPNNINVRNRTKVSLKKPKLNSKGKRKKSANVNTKKK